MENPDYQMSDIKCAFNPTMGVCVTYSRFEAQDGTWRLSSYWMVPGTHYETMEEEIAPVSTLNMYYGKMGR